MGAIDFSFKTSVATTVKTVILWDNKYTNQLNRKGSPEMDLQTDFAKGVQTGVCLLRIKLRVLCILGKHCTTELHLEPQTDF